MDAAQKERLVEEAKQRSFIDILSKAHQGSNAADAVTLRDEILKVGICEAGTLRGLVESLFNKALEDNTTCATLADLCQLMPAHFEPVEQVSTTKERGAGSRGSSEKRIDFRLMVLKKCKEEVDKGSTAFKAIKSWEQKESETKGGLKGDDKIAADANKAACARMLALIKFCGHLYHSGILTEKIIYSCIEALLKTEEDPRPEIMSSLAELLKSIGVKLEAGGGRSSKDGKTVENYFKRIEKIKDEAVSKDIAKMMQSVLTLREKNWVEV